MNHAERVKELAEQYLLWESTGDELHAAIDAMQSALDDAVAARDAWAERWLKSAQKSDELKVKLAARDAEIERLRKDAERLRAVAVQSRSALEKTMEVFWGTCSWHADVKKAIAAIDAALSEEVKGGAL